VSPTVHLSTKNKAFYFVQCVSSVGATFTGAAERVSDWSRFSKTRNAAFPAMIITLPICLTISAVIGVCMTSAFYELYGLVDGTVVWSPLVMLQYVQTLEYTPVCRARTFFAGVGILGTQIFVNLTNNTVPFGMDFAAYFPKYVDMKRGCMIGCILGFACNPWRFLSQAIIFVEIMSGFSSKSHPSICGLCIFPSCSTAANRNRAFSFQLRVRCDLGSRLLDYSKEDVEDSGPLQSWQWLHILVY
jgi:nucleobase:cation symporter-1, NCS1 family